MRTLQCLRRSQSRPTPERLAEPLRMVGGRGQDLRVAGREHSVGQQVLQDGPHHLLRIRIIDRQRGCRRLGHRVAGLTQSPGPVRAPARLPHPDLRLDGVFNVTASELTPSFRSLITELWFGHDEIQQPFGVRWIASPAPEPGFLAAEFAVEALVADCQLIVQHPHGAPADVPQRAALIDATLRAQIPSDHELSRRDGDTDALRGMSCNTRVVERSAQLTRKCLPHSLTSIRDHIGGSNPHAGDRLACR